jgi:negative regulator of genetic competence, sporulation and motility
VKDQESGQVTNVAS